VIRVLVVLKVNPEGISADIRTAAIPGWQHLVLHLSSYWLPSTVMQILVVILCICITFGALLWQCWLGIRKSNRPVKIGDELLYGLWSKVQMICIWSSWCQCNPSYLASI